MKALQALALTSTLAGGMVGCNRPGLITNYKIVEANANVLQLKTGELAPPRPNEFFQVCSVDEHFQQKADEAILAKIAEEIQQEGYERGKSGKPPLSPEEIRTKALTRFRETWRTTVEAIKAKKPPAQVYDSAFAKLKRIKK